jgi:hypothetical protein
MVKWSFASENISNCEYLQHQSMTGYPGRKLEQVLLAWANPGVILKGVWLDLSQTVQRVSQVEAAPDKSAKVT